VDAIEAWQARGTYETLRGRRIFTIDRPADRETPAPPVLILHGFPSCSFDWRRVIDRIGATRRVLLLDFLGFGLSAKPLDHPFSLFEQADIARAFIEVLGLDEISLVTHDMGDSIGGEVLARDLDGALPFNVRARVVTNGSIYMDLVRLSAGQELLLSMPDEVLAVDQAPNRELFEASLAATFGAASQPGAEELEAQWRLLEREGGNRILPRLIRYVEERRRFEDRWTGAIEQHPAALTIVWGDADPIAVYAMAERLHAARPGSTLERLHDIGHYPMIEAPERFERAIDTALP